MALPLHFGHPLEVDGAPRYGDRDRYRSRASSSEVDELGDFAATTLDRPVVEIPESAPRARAQPAEVAPAKQTRLGLILLAIGVIGLLAFAGALVGAYLAFR